MAKKTKADEIIEEIMSDELLLERKVIHKLDLDLGREDLNKMVEKINEIIDRLN